MIYLVYVSSAVREMDDSELLGLLRRSRENNQILGITGLLLYKGGNFMQVLEGLEDHVMALHDKIASDPRHTGMITLIKGPLETRQFAQWAMAFQNVDALGETDLQSFSSFLEDPFTAEVFAQNPHRAIRLLMTFRHIMR